MSDSVTITTPGVPVVNPDNTHEPGTPTYATVKARVTAIPGGFAPQEFNAALTSKSDRLLAVPLGTAITVRETVNWNGDDYNVTGTNVGTHSTSIHVLIARLQ